MTYINNLIYVKITVVDITNTINNISYTVYHYSTCEEQAFRRISQHLQLWDQVHQSWSFLQYLERMRLASLYQQINDKGKKRRRRNRATVDIYQYQYQYQQNSIVALSLIPLLSHTPLDIKAQTVQLDCHSVYNLDMTMLPI
jgi:hypothetical protein